MNRQNEQYDKEEWKQPNRYRLEKFRFPFRKIPKKQQKHRDQKGIPFVRGAIRLRFSQFLLGLLGLDSTYVHEYYSRQVLFRLLFRILHTYRPLLYCLLRASILHAARQMPRRQHLMDSGDSCMHCCLYATWMSLNMWAYILGRRQA